MNKKHLGTKPRGTRTALAGLIAVALLAAAALPVPSAADDRSLVKSSEGEPYVMILLDVTGSMNRIPSDEVYATLRQDDPASRMYQAKEALYAVLGDPRMEGIHFGFATFPNRDFLRARSKLCNPGPSSDNDDCISGNEREDVCSQSNDPSGLCTQVPSATCRGWEPNGDADDLYRGKNFNQRTTSNPNDPGYPAVMRYGDVIPMDWQSDADRAAGERSDNRQRIRERLAPNVIGNPNATADFGVASYFHNTTSDGSLDFIDSNRRPIIAHGGTPLAKSLDDFRLHFADWKAQAIQGDLQLGCKQVHTILITDGLDTCFDPADQRDTAPPAAAAALYAGGDGPSVWVIGYSTGIGTGRNVINNIAQSGGTNACPVVQGCDSGDPTCCPADAGTPGDPSDDPEHAFFPNTQSELIDAIAGILNEIRGGARSFAAAAVPQGQANVSDKTFLASFIPLEDQPLWPGSLDAYLRPLPLTTIDVILPDGTTEERQVPDRAENCAAGDLSACRLWDAGDRMVLQAPTTVQLDDDPPDYNLGQGDAQRRAFYSVEPATGSPPVPAVRKPFVPSPIEEADAEELVGLMGCGTAGSAFPDCDDAGNLAGLHEVVRWVHERKTYAVPDPDPDPGDGIAPGEIKEYLLGEIFHADPVLVGGPENFRYYASDLFSGGRPTRNDFIRDGILSACGDENTGILNNPGFVCYFNRHRLRRKVVLVGSNDGQLHGFDGGVFDGEFDDEKEIVTGRFTNGTGRELFSYIPRAMMPMLAEQSTGAIELYGVDGRVQVADVHIDVGAGPEWRTVVFGGMREGGAGYFALDITQPDLLPARIDEGNIPEPESSGLNNGVGYVPSCTNGGAGCGTLPYPSALWEFYDRCTVLGVTEPCDEDLMPGEMGVGNGVPDLADGWSRPAIGIIEVCSVATSPCPQASIVPKFVAIFGGGLLPGQVTGNFLYMVDVATGQAIYKRQLEGSVPSEAAAVDTDQNGVLDTIYVGTTAGLMYKVDLRTRPQLAAGGRVTDVAWDPFPIFDANLDDNGERPIFFPPSVIFVTERGRFALAFGTGYREDLWADERDDETGRFFVVLDEIVDDSSEPVVVRPFQRGDAIGDPPVLPLGPASLQAIEVEGTDREEDNLLLNPGPNLRAGWRMELEPGEKVIAESFGLSGLLIFLTFQPEEVLGPSGTTCANTGQGRSFTVLTTNGNSIVPGSQRYTLVAELPTSPFTEKGVTKNPDPTGNETEEGIPPALRDLFNELQRLFPPECRFAGHSVNVKTRRSDTGIHFIAPVPICFVQKNWKGL